MLNKKFDNEIKSWETIRAEPDIDPVNAAEGQTFMCYKKKPLKNLNKTNLPSADP